MADASKSGTDKPEPAGSAKPAPARPAELAPAGQSGDPAVQRLLADRQAHLTNMLPDDPEVARRREAAKEAIARIDKELADLGFTAQ